MATLALSVAGAAIGSALLPAGISILGATVTGATIGGQIGALAGSYVDQALLGGSGHSRARGGPRLDDLRVTTSTEGAAIPRLMGRARLGGQVIWAAPLEEEIVKSGSGGGKAGSGGASGRSYRYYANIAVALCEGTISAIGRVWADGKELDLTNVTWRLHTGSQIQAPDDLIVAHVGAEQTPAYRGTAYVVFERLLLESFGNRLPQLSFEVYRAVDPFEQQVRGVVLIPGSGEFVYATTPVTRRVGPGQAETENVHTLQGQPDWSVSLDQLAATLPNVGAVSLVVSWYGSDLRAGHCQVRPCVDNPNKNTSPISWRVAGLTRSTAPRLSYDNGRPAYGGTPSDQTVIAAIKDLKARGHTVTLNPFILMDVPAGNSNPDPYAPLGFQPPYPWRGRVTVHPAPLQPGSPDKSALAADQIAAFVGAATAQDFTLNGDEVVYAGPPEWSFRRMILHYAHLAKAAGGVDGFLLCSELRGLTQSRAGPDSYPFVDALIALAADVRSVVGPDTKISYAADWSEYFGHQPQDGSGDVFFHLDRLWAAPDIDAVAIDAYWPLSDWRDGREHADWQAGHRSPHDLAYLKSNLRGGEGYDWYYASSKDRDHQLRTPIEDGHAGKPWVFRTKDIRSWWMNVHYDRPGGMESATPTAWIPQSKPIWLTEIGCPAIDKGANQPNVFVDPKSSENARPYYSNGTRDDLIQRRYLQALLEGLDPTHPGYLSGANPTSALYQKPMVDLDHVYVYAWDARPYPAYPNNRLAWGDAQNWYYGHWLNGRIASQPLGAVVTDILRAQNFDHIDVEDLRGVVPGYVIDQVMPARDALQALELAYFFDALESGGRIVFRHRGTRPPALSLSPADVVEAKPGADLISLVRAQETDLPASARIAYASSERDYRRAVAEARRLIGASGRTALADVPIVMESDQATQIAESWLFETWTARERARFTLPPSQMALEPGDVIALSRPDAEQMFRIVEVGDHGARDVDAIRIEPEVYAPITAAARPADVPAAALSGQPSAIFLDLPLLLGNEAPETGYVATFMRPWPGAVALYRAPGSSGFELRTLADSPAVIGTTLDDLRAGPPGRIQYGHVLRVQLDGGTLSAATELALFSGANAAAIEHAPGCWEVLQFREARLIGPASYALSALLRGQQGTEGQMRSLLPAGARFVLLDAALVPVAMGPDAIGLPFTWRFGPAIRDLGSPSYDSAVHAFAGIGRRPYAPVHVRGRRAAGDLHISWIRRTRSGGDSWESPEVPLGETAERYEIDILDGDRVVRTLHASSPSVIYTASAQVSDFDEIQEALAVRICQLSDSYGRGSPAHAVL